MCTRQALGLFAALVAAREALVTFGPFRTMCQLCIGTSNVTPGLDRCPEEDTMDDGSGESDWSFDVGEEKEACSQEDSSVKMDVHLLHFWALKHTINS